MRKNKKPELSIEKQLARGPMDMPFLALTCLLDIPRALGRTQEVNR